MNTTKDTLFSLFIRFFFPKFRVEKHTCKHDFVGVREIITDQGETEIFTYKRCRLCNKRENFKQELK